MKKTLMFGIVLSCLIVTAACLIYVPAQEGGYPPPRERVPSTYDTPEPIRTNTSRVGIDFFYDELSSHGYWVEHASHGYVWMPRYVAFNWRPYTNGQWIWTDYGWTWMSHYDWGWAPFHYGRWGWDNSMGWFWAPDTLWGPAWVTWRRGDMYFGWAPLPPQARFMAGRGITSLQFRIHDSAWVFVESRHFPSSRVNRYILPWERNLRIINNTVMETHITMQDRRIFNRGLDIDLVRRASQQRISKYRLVDSRKPGRSKIRLNDIEAYRPAVESRDAARPKSIIPSGEAREKISRSRITGRPGSTSSGKVRLQDIQKREEQLLEESQQKEVTRVKKHKEDEQKKAGTAQEKQTIEKKHNEEITKIRQTHSKEKTRLKKRHEAETQKVKKTKIKK